MNQLDWEHESIESGAERFAYSERTKRENGQADETTAGASVIRQRLLDVATAVETYAINKKDGMGGAYSAALRVAATRHDGEDFYQDYNIVAYIALQAMIQAAYAKNDRQRYLSALALDIGGRLENDQQLYVFKQDNEAFVGKIQDSLRHQNVTSYEHKLKTFQKKFRNAEMQWEPWGKVKRIQVGLRCIKAVLSSMEDCFVLVKKHNGRNMAYYVDTTLEFDDYVIETTEMRAMSMPLSRPLLEKPIPYERIDGEVTGGFHSPAMRRLAPFVKTRGIAHKEFVNAHFPYKHMTAVNNLQSTAWKQNPQVVQTIKEYIRLGLMSDALPRAEKLPLPEHPGDDAEEEDILNWKADAKRIYGLNKQNATDMLNMKKNLDFMNQIGDKPFWFTYSCDFRGRLYCNSPLASLQGEDHLKAMIQFNTGKPVGEQGMRWTAIHGANKYGYDKVDYDARVSWVSDNEQAIRETVSNPTSSAARSFISQADKPFQFLAFCFEWERLGFGTNPEAHGHLPIGLDGSCNGLQHFAALLRDPVGGAGVNLVDSRLPSDIYADVARRLHELARIKAGEPETGDDLRAVVQSLIAQQPDRKLTKRPVMTLPYGATQQSCRQYTREYIKDNAEKFGLHPDDDKGQWKFAVLLTPLLWQAIKDVVKGARDGMDWLQRCASKASREGEYLRWMSPADFPVYQHYSEYDTLRIQTQLFGGVRLRLAGAELGVAQYRARNGIAPNFVHALDSSHMVFTINEAFSRGMDAMACIHDDYGVHAADTEEFFNIIRLTFARMYYDRDWLAAWRMEIQRLNPAISLPEPPEQGDLNVLDVIDSKYFFG